MLSKNLHADLLKMKGLPITLAHILIPIITSGLFLAYYSFSGWSENTKIIAFYQAVGAGFPVLIGIFTASIMEQEQNVGACQNLLTARKKTIAFLSKVILLLIFSLFSVIFATGIFSFGFYKILGCSTVSIVTYMMAAVLMWCCSIPSYTWQMLLAFQFGKGVSVGVGIISGLVSSLMLTNLGMFVWQYIPVSWTARLPYTYLQIALGKSDYICKLFGVMELRARVAAHLRREHREHSVRMVVGHVCFHLSFKQMMIDDKEIPLTKAEYEICEFLARNRGQVFSKEQILEQVFGFDSESNDSTITTHIKNIRTKLSDFQCVPIKTVWGIGYKWEE